MPRKFMRFLVVHLTTIIYFFLFFEKIGICKNITIIFRFLSFIFFRYFLFYLCQTDRKLRSREIFTKWMVLNIRKWKRNKPKYFIMLIYIKRVSKCISIDIYKEKHVAI